MKKTLGIALTVAALLVGSYAIASDRLHPARYVVQKGDTLWDLAGRFLGKPWHWPHIWQANPQIKNPHLIYPGDVLSLTDGGEVIVQVGPKEEPAIPAIPLEQIEPFLKDLRVLDTLEGYPRVVGIEEGHLRGVAGQRVYANGEFEAGSRRYDILRPTLRYARDRSGLTYAEDIDVHGGVVGSQGLDLDKGYSSGHIHRTRGTRILGYELRRMGTGTVARRGAGSDATVVVLEEGGLEVREGDILVPSAAPAYYDSTYYPHAAKFEGARVLQVVDGVAFGGPRDVIVIDAGSQDGVDNGATFSVWSDPTASSFDGNTTLPGEFAAHAMVFRTFANVSYALVMDGVRPVHVNNQLRDPDAKE